MRKLNVTQAALDAMDAQSVADGRYMDRSTVVAQPDGTFDIELERDVYDALLAAASNVGCTPSEMIVRLVHQ